jgi:hypothetical protein
MEGEKKKSDIQSKVLQRITSRQAAAPVSQEGFGKLPKLYSGDKQRYSKAYEVLRSELPQNHPLFPHEQFPMLIGEIMSRTSSAPAFFAGLDDWMLHNMIYRWADQDTLGYSMRTAEEAYQQRAGICSERAFIVVSIAKLLGFDAKFAVRSPKSTHSRPYEHGLAVVNNGPNAVIFTEPCGYYKHEKHGKRELTDKLLEENFSQWRAGKFSYVEWPY